MENEIYHNERDVEVTILKNFFNEIKEEITSVYDIGCNGSVYLEYINKEVETVDGIDLFDDGVTREKLSQYIVEDAITAEIKQYDLVLCISTLEHVGYQPEHAEKPKEMRMQLAKKIGEVANKYMFLTFPYGKAAVHENCFANVTNQELAQIQEAINAKTGMVKFYNNENPANEKSWQEIPLEEADLKEYDPKKGVRTIAVLIAEK